MRVSSTKKVIGACMVSSMLGLSLFNIIDINSVNDEFLASSLLLVLLLHVICDTKLVLLSTICAASAFFAMAAYHTLSIVPFLTVLLVGGALTLIAIDVVDKKIS